MKIKKIEEVKVDKKNSSCILVVGEKGITSEHFENQKIFIDPKLEYFEALNYSNALKRVLKYEEGKIKELQNLRLVNKNCPQIKIF